MKRKINRVGPSTLTVSLPSKWAKNLGLKAGDEIEVEERANHLVIGTQRSAPKREITIPIESPEHFLKRFLVIPYVKGYDSIKIIYQDPKIYTLVQETMNKMLLGFEIIHHGKNECILKNIAESIDNEYDNNERKYFLHIKQIVEHLVNAVKDKDMQEIEHLLLLDATVDKLCHFMRRILNTKGHKDESKGKSRYYINNLLETISDRCRDIAIHIKSTSQFPPAGYVELLELTKKNIELLYDMFYNYNIEKILELKQRNLVIQKRIIEEYSKTKQIDFLYYHYLLSIAELTHNLSEDIGL